MATIDVPGPLVELLFVRAAWGLDVAPDIPAGSPPPDPGASVRPERAGLEGLWGALWQQALVWRVSWPPSGAVPSWVAVYGTDGLDLLQLRLWTRAVRSDLAAAINAQLAEDGGATGLHRRTYHNGRIEDAAALGVSTVLVLPVSGYYASRPAADTIVLSREAFTDDEQWKRSLDADA